MHQAIYTEKGAKPLGPYSQGIVAQGKLVFLSGQGPVDPAPGKLVLGPFREQAERTLNNVGTLLEAAGVEFGRTGVSVDDRLRSTNKRIYAAGDVCSRYKFTPLTSAHTPLGEHIAGHLDEQFTRYGPPLSIKRDNGGNLNHHAVNQLLEDAMVVPINSPVMTAAYNGAVERAQGELKRHLNCRYKAKTTGEFALLAESATHDLNHKPRRGLGGNIACRVYFGNNRMRYPKRQRKSIYDWIYDLAAEISTRAGKKKITPVAWRV